MYKELYTADAHPPREIARMVKHLGVAKAQTDAVTLVVLAVLAGAFISLGSVSFCMREIPVQIDILGVAAVNLVCQAAAGPTVAWRR